MDGRTLPRAEIRVDGHHLPLTVSQNHIEGSPHPHHVNSA